MRNYANNPWKTKQKSSEFTMNTDVVGATPSSVKPRDGTTIPYYTIIWASGVTRKQTQSLWLSSLVALANVLLGQSSDYEEEVKGSERLD